MSNGEDVWAMVIAPGGSGGYVRRSIVRFERGICFVIDPGKNMFDLYPHKIDRLDSVTIVVATGLWHYGDVRMVFDSSTDADMIEEKLKEQLAKRKTKNPRLARKL